MLKGRIHSLESFGTVDGPGIRFVVFLQGCPLRCEYCHNPDTWDPAGEANDQMTADELLAEVLPYKRFIAKGGVTITGGEPLLQAPFVKDFFRLCREQGIHTALDTSGFICTAQAFEVLDFTDLVLLDIKTLDPDLHPVLTGVKRDNALRFLDELDRRGMTTWIRHVVVPGRTDHDAWLEALAEYISRYPVVKKVELLPYHTMGVFKYEQLGIAYPLKDTESLSSERLDNARLIFSRYGF